MGPTRSIERYTILARKRTGVDSIMVKGADSRVAAGVAAVEEGSRGEEDFRAAVGEAEGGTRTRGIAKIMVIRATITKEIITKKITTIKAISSSRGITMIIITTMVKVGETDRDLPRDKDNRIHEISTAFMGVIRTPRGIISMRNLGQALQVRWGLGGAIM